MRIAPFLPLLAALAATPAVAQSHGDWTVGFGQGYLEHRVRNGPGNEFRITCDVGATEAGGASIDVLVAGAPPPPDSTVRFFVDGEEVTMGVDSEGGIGTDCNVCTANFEFLWKRLRSGRQLVAALEDGRSSPFSLRGSAAALDAKPCDTGFTGLR